MRFLSLFSGVEAASLAFSELGWQCVAVAETDPFACDVLKHHWPNIPNLGDVTKITREQIEALGRIDLVIGGFPCQDLSIAGKRKGLKNADGTHTRSGLFFIAEQICQWSGARWTVIENVPGLFSSHGGRDFASVAGELAGAEVRVPAGGWRNSGVFIGPKGLVEFAVLDAQYFGLAQRRKRVFLFRDSGDWPNRPPVLFDSACVSRDFAPRREAGKDVAADVAPCIGASGRGFERAGGTRGQDCVIPVLAGTVLAGGQRYPGTSADNADSMLIAHALRGEGFDTSEDGTGRGTPIVSHCLNAGGMGRQDFETDTLVQVRYSVRRLTPLECERLQGMKDGHTLVPRRNGMSKDGPRYKAIGNSFAVNCVRWIGRQIEYAHHYKPE